MKPAAVTSLPGVVLVGIETPIGLALIRELGGHGVAVHGIARHSSALGLHSRFLASGVVHSARDDALIALILDQARSQGATCLMAVSENDILFLNQHRPRLGELKLLIPDLERIQQVIDKSSIYDIAVRVGITVPRDWKIRRLEDLADVRGEIRFPVVLKWSDPFQVIKQLYGLGLPYEKARYCYDVDDLESVLRTYSDIGKFPLVQEFCPGHGLGQMILMFNGEPELCFQHARIHEWPPEGGTSTLCVSVSQDKHRELMAQSISLLKAIRWEGPAMVEYRHDPITAQSVLMEINGRYWGSYPLATDAGAHFAWTHLCLAANGISPKQPDYRAGQKSRFLIPELKRLYRIVFQPTLVQNRNMSFNKVREIAEFLWYPLGSQSAHYIFKWKDIGPFIADLAVITRSGLKKISSKILQVR